MEELSCKRFKGIAITKDIPDMVAVVRLRCKMWDCEYCSKKNRHIWYAHLSERLPDVSTNWYFITLTAHSHSHASGKTLEACQRGIDLLLKRLRHIAKVSYVRVFEKHKSGAIHAHLILSGIETRVYWRKTKNGGKSWNFKPISNHSWSIKSWLKKQAIEVGLGYQVDCEHIGGDIQKTCNYILKYMTKDMQSGFDKKGLRRIACSQNIGTPKPESEYSWFLAEGITPRDLYLADREKRIVYDLSAKHQVTLDDFEHVNIYPPELQ